MVEKTKHIVFRVLNYLYSKEAANHELLPNDERILINLASHNGIKGICPSIKTIAKELRITERYVKERLSAMKNKPNFIKVHSNSGKIAPMNCYF